MGLQKVILLQNLSLVFFALYYLDDQIKADETGRVQHANRDSKYLHL